MLGAIAGDIIGSIYEHRPVKEVDFPLFHPRSRFTDDTVLTVAVADCLLYGKDYATTVRQYARNYPNAGYGGSFRRWAATDEAPPYNSWGNGSAMRVCPVGYAFESLDEVLREARRSAEITHNHSEGVKGAQAVAAAVFLARQGHSKKAIKAYIEENTGYNLHRRLADIRPAYQFDVSCQGSVPEALIAFLESENFEGAVRNAISLGGDSDTQACIAGAVAEAYYDDLPQSIIDEVHRRLPESFLQVIRAFADRFIP